MMDSQDMRLLESVLSHTTCTKNTLVHGAAKNQKSTDYLSMAFHPMIATEYHGQRVSFAVLAVSKPTAMKHSTVSG